MRQINLRVSGELLGRIDLARGLVARERWLRGVVERALSEAEGSAEQASVDTRASSPAGREARLEASAEPARPALASPRGASRPAPVEPLSRSEMFRRAGEKR